jgi:hypothetical protein
MRASSLSNAKVIDRLNHSFIPVHADVFLRCHAPRGVVFIYLTAVSPEHRQDRWFRRVEMSHCAVTGA